MRRHPYFILDEETKNPIAVEDVMVWAAWYETADRRVALDQVEEWQVSTVFLSISSNLDDAPRLFETMVYRQRPGSDDPQDAEWLNGAARYRTWSEAEWGHQAVVNALTLRLAAQNPELPSVLQLAVEDDGSGVPEVTDL